MVRNEMSTLLSIHLHPIRHILRPLSDDEILQNHLSDTYVGPDFLHRPHVPRMNFNLNAADMDEREQDVKDRETAKHDIRAYLYRICDILMMTTLTWGDINLFVASMFSSFSEYSLLW